ncbi:hypothetical protein OPIT5_04695 [Opitutaceae bacterium TAV5]|nr:hypothetical protein OPIT5_04695 [Opitutaceae bacterium TAV5]
MMNTTSLPFVFRRAIRRLLAGSTGIALAVVFSGLAALAPVRAADTWTLTLAVSDTQGNSGGGTTSITSPASLNPAAIPSGTAVTIKAVPASGYSFIRWETEPANVLTAPYSLEATAYMTQNIRATAIFAPGTLQLKLGTSPARLGGTATGGGYYEEGSSASIAATPNPGFRFDRWEVKSGTVAFAGNDPTRANTIVVLGSTPVNNTWELVAMFEQTTTEDDRLTLEVPDGGGTATATPTFSGYRTLTATPDASDSDRFPLNTPSIELLATPAEGYRFVKWEGVATNPGLERTTLILTGNVTVRAIFEPDSFSFTLAMVNEDGGADVGSSKVSGGNGAISVSIPPVSSARVDFPMDSVITLTAVPDSSRVFRRWITTGIDSPAGNPGIFTMGPRPAKVTAVFARKADLTVNLGVDTGGTGGNASATVTGSFTDPANDATVTINRTATPGQPVVVTPVLKDTPLTFIPDGGTNFRFVRWTGDISDAQATSNPLALTLTESKTLTAGFERIRSDLTVTISPAAAATAGARVINADTSADLTGATNHPVNAILALKPAGATSAETAWIFDHWEGDLTGTADPASITLPTDRTVTAVFRQQHVLTLKTDPIYQGNFTVSTGSLSYDSGSGTWTGIYAGGTTVTITVAPVDSRGFSGWTGDTAGLSAVQLATNPLTVTMDRSRTLIATIDTAARFRIAVMPDRRETMTPVVLPDSEADKIRISGHFSIGGRAYGYIRPFPDAPATVDVAYASTSGSVALSAPELVTDSNDVVWQFVSWATGINEWDAVPQPWGRSHTLNTADLGGSANILALYTDKRALRPTVTLDGFTSTAVNIKADSAVLTTGAEKKYTWNQTAALEAYPQTGVVFSSWGGEAQPDAVDRTRALTTMNVDRTNVIARYKTAIPVTLDIVVEGGSATPSQFAAYLTATLPGEETEPVSASLPRIFQVGKGDTITFAATASTVTLDAGLYRFKGWDTDGDGAVDQTGASLSRIADAAQTIRAVFVRTWTLETLTDPAGAGSITRTPASTVYDHGATVILTANNGTGYVFDHWSETSAGSFTGGYQDGTSATDQTIHIVMVADQSLTAHYESAKNALSVNVNVNGTLNPPAHTGNLPFIADGTPLTAPGSKTYNYGEHANITATVPAAGGEYRFAGWNPPASQGTNNPIVVEMLGAQAATAHYKTRCLVTFSVETVGGGTGGAPSVTGHTAMVGSSWACYHGDSITLTANPASGYRFLRWEIDTDGNPATIEITDIRPAFTGTITADWQVKAVYAKEYTLTFATNPAGGAGGTVNKPATYVAYHGEKITDVIASPRIDYDWYFTKWSVSPDAMDLAEPSPSGTDNTDTNPLSFVVNDSHVITANFSRAGQERTLTLNIRLDGVDNPAGCPLTVLADGSSVAGHTDPTRLPGGGTKLYYRGDQPRLDATPADAAGASLAADYDFVGWGDSASANPVRTLSAVLGDTPVTAIYRTKAVLYMQVQPAGVATTTPVPPDGTPYATYLGENVTLSATPVAAHIDDYAFEKWTSLPAASPPNPVNHYNSVININAKERTAIAHFKPGCRLEVKAKYETTPRPDDTRTYGIASGTRTTAAVGAGNSAAIRSPFSGEPDSAIKTVIIDEGTGKASARIVAVPASPAFRFVRWDIDDNNDGVIDRTLSAASGDIVMDSAIGRNVTAYAIFEKTTVTLTVHTVPAGIPEKVDGTADTASTGSPVNITAEPKTYRYFYGDTANLQAIDNSDGAYAFGGWYRGEGYSALANDFISSSLVTGYGPLRSDAVVTAVFWPGGKYRIILFLEPKDRKIDIHNLSALGTFTLTYMKIDGRDACVVGFTDGLSSGAITPPAEAWVHRGDTDDAAPSLSGWTSAGMQKNGPLPIDTAPAFIIPLRAAQSVTGWNNETNEPEVRAFLWWEMAPESEQYDHLLFDRTKHDQAYFVCPELDTMDPAKTPRIIARYEPPGGAAIKLEADFVDEAADFIKPGAGAGWIQGTIHGTSMIKGEYLLYVSEDKHGDWTDKISLGMQEQFIPDAAFTAGPLKIVSWDYDPDTRDGIDNRQTNLPGPEGFTMLDPLQSGQEQLAVAHLDVETWTVSILKPHFQTPPGWPQPVFSGTAGFNLDSIDYNHTGNKIDDYYQSVEVSPVTDPATTLAERRFVKGSSAPGLHTSSTSGDYIFAGWDTAGGTTPNLSVNAFSWSGGTASWPGGAWPATMTGDRQVRPIYTIRHPLTLSITPVDSTDKHHFYLETSPYGIEVPDPEDGATSKTKSYAQGSRFTLKASSTDPYHVIKSWIIRKDVNGDGTYSEETVIVADNGTGNLPGEKTHELTLDYPARSEVVFGWQQFEVRLDVANSKDGNRHGDVKLDGVLLTPRADLPKGKVVDYGTTLDIQAIADAGYIFKGWTPDNDNGPANPGQAATTVFVNAAKTLTAHFERKVTLVLATDPAGLPANVISPEAGSWDELPAGTLLTDGVIVSGIKALDRTGYDFSHWTIVDGHNPDPAHPRTVASAALGDLELYGDAGAKITVTAHYARLHNLTINAQGPDADGAEESRVAASPSPSIDGQAMVAVANSNPSVTGQYREYLEGESHTPPRTITLTPSAGTHYEFDRWEITRGGTPLTLTPAAGTHAVTLPSFTADVVATAFFKKKNYTITVAAWKAANVPLPPGSDGSIASVLRSTAPVTQNFPLDGASGSISVPYKSEVALTTSPASRFSFDKWTDSGSNDLGSDIRNPSGYVFRVTGDRTVRAEFVREEYQLTTAVAPDASYGAITASVPRGGNPSWHVADTAVTLTAVPSVVTPGVTSYLFREWTTTRNGVAEAPGAPASATLELKMDADWTATARFVKAVRIKVDVNAISAVPGTPGGSITGITGYKHQDADGYYVFAEGDPVTITAAANEHFTFSEWTGAPGDAVRTDTGSPATHSKLEFTASADTEITANFTAKTYTLVVTSDPAAAARTLVAHQPLEPDHDFLSQGQELSRQYPQAITLATSAVGATAGDPPPHYRFLSWREGNSALGTSPTLPFIFNRNASLRAVFTRQIEIRVNESLDITRSPEVAGQGGSATLSTSGGQGPFSGVGEYRLDVPDTLRITVTPATGYEFAEWRGLPAGATVDPATGAVSLPLTEALAGAGDLEITPCFRLKLYALTTSVWDAWSQTASTLYASVGISPSPHQGNRYYHGTAITAKLTALASGYRFLGWDLNGDLAPEITDDGTGTHTFVITGPVTVRAVVHRTYTLTLQNDPSDGSRGQACVVSPLPVSSTSPVSPPVAPSVSVYDAGTAVRLLAEPAGGAEFIGWAGNVSNPRSADTTVEMTANQSITARFGTRVYHDLTVNVAAPSTAGTVKVNEGATGAFVVGGAGPASGTGSYPHGEIVSLLAEPVSADYEFSHWSGDALTGASSIASNRIEMNASRSVTAHFRRARHELTVLVQPGGAGAVTPSGGTYDHGTVVTLTANSNPGYTFLGWDTDGDNAPDNTNATLPLTMDQDRTVAALFTSTSPTGSVRVIVLPTSSAATWTIAPSAEPGEDGVQVITLRPTSGYGFSGWGPGADSSDLYGKYRDTDGSQIARILVEGNKTVVANLFRQQVTLVTDVLPTGKGIVAPGDGSYNTGTQLDINATVTDGTDWSFLEWRGDPAWGPGSGPTSNPGKIVLNADTYVRAVFRENPKTFRVTVGFDELTVGLPGDRAWLGNDSFVTLGSAAILQDYLPEGTPVDIQATVEDPFLYRFVRWTGVPDHLIRNTGGGYTLLVNEAVNPRALILPINPLLVTRAMTEGEEEEESAGSGGPLYECAAGKIDQGGICDLNEKRAVYAWPRPGWKVVASSWNLSVTSEGGSSSIVHDEAPPEKEGAVGIYVRLGTEVSYLTVRFVKEDAERKYYYHIEGSRYQLDDARSPGVNHYISEEKDK